MGTMWIVLLGVGAASFIGYLIWLIVCIRNWDSKIPPIIGMALSLVMLVGGLSGVPEDTPDNGEKPSGNETSSDEPSGEEPFSVDEGIWYVDYYKDDFQQATDEWYITAPPFSGTFSNRAFTDKELTVEVLVDRDGKITFLLYTHGKDLLKNTYRDEMIYDITMRTPDGSDHKMTGTMYPDTDRLRIDDSFQETALEALAGEGTISFYIEEADSPMTNFLFSVEADNFGSVYQSQING